MNKAQYIKLVSRKTEPKLQISACKANSTTLVYLKPMSRNLHFSYIVQNHSGIVMFTYSIYEY